MFELFLHYELLLRTSGKMEIIVFYWMWKDEASIVYSNNNAGLDSKKVFITFYILSLLVITAGMTIKSGQREFRILYLLFCKTYH